MAIKKSDLYSSLWKNCDELRGGMDASQYKDYILTLLFVKYVTDKAKTDRNALRASPGTCRDRSVGLMAGQRNVDGAERRRGESTMTRTNT